MNHLKFLAKWCEAKIVQSWWIYGSIYSLVFIPTPQIFPNFIVCLFYGCPHFPLFFHSLALFHHFSSSLHRFSLFFTRSFAKMPLNDRQTGLTQTARRAVCKRYADTWMTIFKWAHQFQIVYNFHTWKHTLNISLFGDIVCRAHSKQILIIQPISELILNFNVGVELTWSRKKLNVFVWRCLRADISKYVPDNTCV